MYQIKIFEMDNKDHFIPYQTVLTIRSFYTLSMESELQTFLNSTEKKYS